jgi:hypothetical protein
MNYCWQTINALYMQMTNNFKNHPDSLSAPSIQFDMKINYINTEAMKKSKCENL